MALFDHKGKAGLALAKKAGQQLTAIARFIGAKFDIEKFGEGRQQVDLTDEGVGDPGLNAGGPAHDQGHPRAAFVDLVLATTIDAGAVVPVVGFFAGGLGDCAIPIAIVVDGGRCRWKR